MDELCRPEEQRAWGGAGGAGHPPPAFCLSLAAPLSSRELWPLRFGERAVRLRPPALLVVQLAARRLAQAQVDVDDQHHLL